MISHFRAMIYACGMWRNGYYIMLAQQVYHTAWPYITSRSDISLASKSYHRSPTSCHRQLSWSFDVTFRASCCIGGLLQLFESIFWRTKKDAARWAASQRDKKLPHVSLRGAKRRCNLVQEVPNSPKTTRKSRLFCEIATAASGLAMTKSDFFDSLRCSPMGCIPA